MYPKHMICNLFHLNNYHQIKTLLDYKQRFYISKSFHGAYLYVCFIQKSVLSLLFIFLQLPYKYKCFLIKKSHLF